MTQIFKADHARRIELAGVGPAPRPVDIDQAQTGFAALRTLRIYRFDPPATVHGHAEEDEVFIVVLCGEVELQMRSEHWSRNDARFVLEAADAASPVACVAYLPPHAEYALTPRTPADVAYARARPISGRSPAVFTTAPLPNGAGTQLLLDESSHAERLRLQLWQIRTREIAADLMPANRPVAAGEILIYVRAAPVLAVTVDAQDLPTVALESWDTLAVSAGEWPRLRVAARSSALSLVVSAA